MTDLLPERVDDGDDLVIRLWADDDAEALSAAVVESIEHLRPWMAWIEHEPLSIDDRRAFIAEGLRQWAEGGDAVYGIWLDGRVAGGTGLHRRGVPRTLEIGYWLHPAFVGRGVASRVASALTSAALDVPVIDAVEIHHALDNQRSAAVPQRLGYQRLAGVDHRDHAAWRIERAQWDVGPNQAS
jgi:ribosomal-protein-serine acetyltransferase